MRSMLFLLNMQFFAFVTAALTPLSCETMDESRMSNAPYMKCSTGLRVVGSVALVGYGVAGPLMLGWVARRNMHSPIYAQFHGSFSPSAKYWELVLILRRIVFLTVTLTIPVRSVLRAISQVCVLVLSSIVHLWLAPFARREENVSEMVSLGLLVVNGMVSVSRRVATGTEVKAPEGIDGALTACFVLHVLFVVYCGARISFGARVRNWLRKTCGHLWPWGKDASAGTATDGLRRPLL